MKTRTKLLAALLSTVTALSCALTAAAAPAITMQGNEMTPADGTKDGTLTFTITASDFGEVAGADLEITIPDGVLPSAVEVKSNNNSWEALYANNANGSGNYIFKDNVLKIVDVFNVGKSEENKITTLDLTVTVDFKAGATIGTYNTTENVKLVDNDRNKITGVTVTPASLVVGKESAELSGAEKGYCFDDEYKFLPYGVLTDGEGNFLKKDNEGKFTFTGSKTATYYKQPAGNDVTTFGASRKEDDSTIQFGSYINNIAATADSCGTVLVFSKSLEGTSLETNYVQGDFDGALAYYNGSLNTLLNGIVKAYESVGDKTKFYPYVYGDNKIIYVRVVKQTSYMWKSSEAAKLNKLQYAVRCKVSDVNRVFTAAGYIYNKTADEYSFSKEVKSASVSKLG